MAGFGSGVYLEAAMTQAHNSLEKILKQGATTGVADKVMVNTLLADCRITTPLDG